MTIAVQRRSSRTASRTARWCCPDTCPMRNLRMTMKQCRRICRGCSRCSSPQWSHHTHSESLQGKQHTACTQYWPPRPGTRLSSRRTCRSCLFQHSPAASLLRTLSTRSILPRCTLPNRTPSRPLHSSHSRTFLVYTPSKRQHPCRLGICRLRNHRTSSAPLATDTYPYHIRCTSPRLMMWSTRPLRTQHTDSHLCWRRCW
jgi:hypothetical protein